MPEVNEPTPEQQAEAESLCITYSFDSPRYNVVLAVAAIVRDAEQRGAAREREACAAILHARAAYHESRKSQGGWKWGEGCEELKCECVQMAAALEARP